MSAASTRIATCQQFLICRAWAVHAWSPRRRQPARQEIALDTTRGMGVYVPPLVWATQFRYTPDAMLLVLASEPYDADDYIRDYDEFLAVVAGRSRR